MAQLDDTYKVKLVSSVTGRRVTFYVSPQISENRSVEYKQADTIHTPGSVQIYVTTPSRTYGVSDIKLISRTMQEATANLYSINQLRGWTMPYFGTRSSTLSTQNRGDRQAVETFDLSKQDVIDFNLKPGVELLGAPPDVLFFTAYSDNKRVGKVPTNINRVPVVISSLNIVYPNDVDYVPTEDGVPFPTVMTISFDLTETHTPRELSSQFSIFAFKRGKLTNF